MFDKSKRSTKSAHVHKYFLAPGNYVLTMLSREQNRVFSQTFSALQQLSTLLFARRTRIRHGSLKGFFLGYSERLLLDRGGRASIWKVFHSIFGGVLQSINVIKSWARNSCVCSPQIKDVNLIKDSCSADQKYLPASRPCLHVCLSFWQEKPSRPSNKPGIHQKISLPIGLDLRTQTSSWRPFVFLKPCDSRNGDWKVR